MKNDFSSSYDFRNGPDVFACRIFMLVFAVKPHWNFHWLRHHGKVDFGDVRIIFQFDVFNVWRHSFAERGVQHWPVLVVDVFRNVFGSDELPSSDDRVFDLRIILKRIERLCLTLWQPKAVEEAEAIRIFENFIIFKFVVQVWSFLLVTFC